jgi:hypothetical protein
LGLAAKKARRLRTGGAACFLPAWGFVFAPFFGPVDAAGKGALRAPKAPPPLLPLLPAALARQGAAAADGKAATVLCLLRRVLEAAADSRSAIEKADADDEDDDEADDEADSDLAKGLGAKWALRFSGCDGALPKGL